MTNATGPRRRPGVAVLRTRLERRNGEWYGVIDEVRGRWRTESGPVVPRSLVKVARGGAPAPGGDGAGLLAVGTADGRLVVCGAEAVRPGESILGTVYWVQPPGGPDAQRRPDDA